MTTFEFLRFRYRFRTLAPLWFPPGRTANLVRGAFGAALRQTAPLPIYTAFFEPHPGPAGAPSGFADLPRPFVLRPWHLDGRSLPTDAPFHLDLHIFDLSSPALPYLAAAFDRFRWNRPGDAAPLARLETVEQLDLAGEPAAGACVLGLDPDERPVLRAVIGFATPTELKSGGALAAAPDFPILFARLRDRISTLRALYGPGPPAVDFRTLGSRAALVRLCRTELVQHHLERRSASSGRVHPLGGFTGQAEYRGDLRPFLPWLRAARWTGVGRQTAWGKGEVLVLVEDVIPGERGELL